METSMVVMILLLVVLAVALGLFAHWRLGQLRLDDVSRAFWGFTILLFPVTGPIASFLALARTPRIRPSSAE